MIITGMRILDANGQPIVPAMGRIWPQDGSAPSIGINAKDGSGSLDLNPPFNKPDGDLEVHASRLAMLRQ